MALHFASLALICAVALSSVATHWAVMELSGDLRHVRIAEKDDEEEAERKPLLESGERSDADARNELGAQVLARKNVKWSVCSGCLALISLALLIGGACIPYLKVVRGGFLGKLIRPQEDQTLHISIFY